MFDRLRMMLIRRAGRPAASGTEAAARTLPPGDVAALRSQGNALLAEGDVVAAENAFRQALALQRDDAKSLICLGYALKEQGRPGEARAALQRALEVPIDESDACDAQFLMGQLGEQQADLAEAQRHYAEALRLKPGFAIACAALRSVLDRQGRQAQARELLERSVRLCPDCVDYRMWLAKVCTEAFDFQGVATHLGAAVALGVKDAGVYAMLGSALFRLGQEAEALRIFGLAVAMDPGLAYEALYHRGYFHFRGGHFKEAVAFVEQSIEAAPGYLPAHSLLLMLLSFVAADVGRSYREAALRFARAVRSQIPSVPHRAPPRAARHGSAVRVGLVSGEFMRHPVYYFLIGMLPHLDRQRFHLVAYSNKSLEDSATEELKAQIPDWHEIRDLSDDAVADLVRSHEIDVLIDLGGHTGDNRLPVFARKPAPVQVTWLGYWASTGLEEMDYIIADPVCVPEDSSEWFSEKVVRLPATRLCMAAPRPSRDLPVAPPPCLKNGHVTFGSYQQGSKLSSKVVSVWIRVLLAVPNSRLRIQAEAIRTTSLGERIRGEMTRAGIDLARVDLVGSTGWEAYLESHREVDVLLDTFPYPGGTTTAFALWMGVPTITLAGNTMLSSQGAAMLDCVGLPDWVVQGEDAYVAAAARLAADTEGLARLRAELRARALASPLFDGRKFARDWGAALDAMCQEKLANR